MVRMSDFTFPSAHEGISIHCRRWQPDGPVRGVVQIVHGVAEHIGRYGEFADYLAENGFVAVGDDHLGHGLSVGDESERGWFAEENGWELLIADEKTLRDKMRAEFPDKPLILLGHSLGSFMVRTYIGEYPDDVDLCILCGTGSTPGPFCRLGCALAQREIRRRGSKYRSPALQSIAFGSYMRGIKNPIGAYDWICRDENVLRAYDADPLCGFVGTAELMYELLHGLELIGRLDHMRKMRRDLPVLFISGDADPVGRRGKDVRLVYDRFLSVGMRDVELKLYPGARHEVLNELNKREVWADVLDWLERRL